VGVKDRLRSLDKTQVWLIRQLRDKGVVVQPPEMSSILNEVYTYPKAQRILKMCDNILTEAEQNAT
jgi:hypothetical protein